jgi:cell division transport system ATP-binding protein
MIQLFQVSKRFGSNLALSEIGLKIRRGEFVFVTGPSGAGKTTLLRLIFGAEKPTDGQILINGINLTRINRLKLDLLRRKIGKTIYQNVALALDVTGERSVIIRKKCHQALRAVGLSKKEKAYPLQISGGEQQRTAIARAIINDPLILLADEPTGNLDPDITREIMILFRSINLRGTTVVIATHNKELMKDTDQRVIILNNGRIVGER